MQAIAPQSQPHNKISWSRKIGYLLLPPFVALIVLALLAVVVMARYRQEHDGRIYAGVSIGGVDVGGLTQAEAEAALNAAFPYAEQGNITFVDALTSQEWTYAPAELGVLLDTKQTSAAALAMGRESSPLRRLNSIAGSWYYGRSLAPAIVFDEGRMDETIAVLASEIDHPAVDASLTYENGSVAYTPGQPGRELDKADLRERLTMPLGGLQEAEVGLLIHETLPAVYDDTAVAAEIQNVLADPLSFYLSEPLDDLDLGAIELPQDTLASWLRINVAEDGNGALGNSIIVDENAARHWLRQFADEIYREPVNARFYFDDDTRELVLVAPHINGRSLDIDATVANFLAQVGSSNRAVPIVITEIAPTVHAGATAVELGITEEITSTTTWFYGSTDARKHNIARAAANFFGVVIAPGEEFSFNKYLGSISETDGYEEGLIIVGGRTIKGIGGGVCQVSTTLYQAAFLSGFPITERWEHGYMLNYYNDGQGPGMDATVYSPIVDIKFINNTPHHLLIENYYNEEFEALTFKFYSTGMGREVVKTQPLFTNERPAPEDDVWEFDPDLEPGTVVQIDWATFGADVFVDRTVYNAAGDLILDETVVSNYIPYPNVFHYGPGVEPGDYSLVPDH